MSLIVTMLPRYQNTLLPETYMYTRLAASSTISDTPNTCLALTGLVTLRRDKLVGKLPLYSERGAEADGWEGTWGKASSRILCQKVQLPRLGGRGWGLGQ